VPERRVVREGIVAGLIGAAVVAVWILIFDVLQGRPLETPAILGAVLLHGARDPQAVPVTAGAVLGYTVLHGLAFVLVGVIAAFLVAGAEREPAMLVALLVFFAAFEVFFLALVVFLARPLLGVLAWWEILIGNFLATVCMLWYFFLWHRGLARTLTGRWVGVIREGVMAGLIGGGVVAVWFLVYDTPHFRPFWTPALLGAAIFEGVRDPALVTVRPDLVIGYTVVHFAAFALFGVVAAGLLVAAEYEPRLLIGMCILFACFEIFFLGFVSALAEAMVGVLRWWNIAVGNLLATLAMLLYFFLGHRSLGARLFAGWTED
jgi:hypothetical protein